MKEIKEGCLWKLGSTIAKIIIILLAFIIGTTLVTLFLN